MDDGRMTDGWEGGWIDGGMEDRWMTKAICVNRVRKE